MKMKLPKCMLNNFSIYLVGLKEDFSWEKFVEKVDWNNIET